MFHTIPNKFLHVTLFELFKIYIFKNVNLKQHFERLNDFN